MRSRSSTRSGAPTSSSTSRDISRLPGVALPVSSTASLRSGSATSRAGEHTECAGTTNNPLIAGNGVTLCCPGRSPFQPRNAAAAVFNLTAVGGTAPTTFLSVTPALAGHTCPASAPAFLESESSGGTALPNRVISKLGPNEDVCIYSAAGQHQLHRRRQRLVRLVGRAGWRALLLDPAHSGLRHATDVATPPVRSHRAAGLAPGQTDPILIAGSRRCPADNVHSTAPVAVVANLTGIAGTATTFFTLYPSDAIPDRRRRTSTRVSAR